MKFLGLITKGGVSNEESKELDSKYDKRRTAVRFAIFDKDNNIALNHRPEQYGFKYFNTLPGGGVEEGESIEEAVRREAVEETGCNIKDIEEIGWIMEYIPEANLIQKTYAFSSKIEGDKCEPVFTEDEKKSNLGLMWAPLDKAVKMVEGMEDCNPRTRSLMILNEIKNR
jgi:8-oxo-dGTP pyrophosphatase MutT (NUDIX family)